MNRSSNASNSSQSKASSDSSTGSPNSDSPGRRSPARKRRDDDGNRREDDERDLPVVGAGRRLVGRIVGAIGVLNRGTDRVEPRSVVGIGCVGYLIMNVSTRLHTERTRQFAGGVSGLHRWSKLRRGQFDPSAGAQSLRRTARRGATVQVLWRAASDGRGSNRHEHCSVPPAYKYVGLRVGPKIFTSSAVVASTMDIDESVTGSSACATGFVEVR
ncbi:hypothetical protein D8S78_05340 [Natrialba swarupiae]|nr:hypothetical protein [Natrialba swarupiae]